MQVRVVTSSQGKLSYELSKKNIKKMYLRVQKDGRITVSTPKSVTVKEADAFVQNNEAFIFQGLEKIKTRAEEAPPPHSFQSGDRFFFLGQSLTLELRNGFLSPVKKEGDLLVVQLPFPMDGSLPPKSMVADALNEFYSKEISRIFFDLMKSYQEKLAPLGIPTAFLKVRKMKSQWGSCNRRNNAITLNSNLIYVPLELIDYVVLHEFCHFIHGNHSKDFYDLVAVYMPDWKERRQSLKQWSHIES
ncbi:MAG: SprT family zinc-dependent metalloprotease [Eubacteriales bacterium]